MQRRPWSKSSQLSQSKSTPSVFSAPIQLFSCHSYGLFYIVISFLVHLFLLLGYKLHWDSNHYSLFLFPPIIMLGAYKMIFYKHKRYEI